jgi:hypothetical protein
MGFTRRLVIRSTQAADPRSRQVFQARLRPCLLSQLDPPEERVPHLALGVRFVSAIFDGQRTGRKLEQRHDLIRRNTDLTSFPKGHLRAMNAQVFSEFCLRQIAAHPPFSYPRYIRHPASVGRHPPWAGLCWVVRRWVVGSFVPFGTVVTLNDSGVPLTRTPESFRVTADQYPGEHHGFDEALRGTADQNP